MVGVSDATLSLWLSGTYKGNVARIDRLVERWLTTRRETERRSIDAAGLDEHRDLVLTQEIMAALAHGQANGDIVLVHGPSGSGKSWASERYCDDRAAAWYVSMTGAVRSLSGMLGRVCAAVDVVPPERSALSAETALVERLRGREALLVVDEAHHLGARLVDELRCIRDMAGCGLALVGDETVRITLGRCPQVVGRIGTRVAARAPGESEVVELVAPVLGRTPTAEDVRECLAVARAPGGMHTLRRALARAWIRSREQEAQAISAELLGEAAREATRLEAVA